jgi:hypothetical protein
MHLQKVSWCCDHPPTKIKVCKITWGSCTSHSHARLWFAKKKNISHLPLIIDNNGFLNKKVVIVMKACAR